MVQKAGLTSERQLLALPMLKLCVSSSGARSSASDVRSCHSGSAGCSLVPLPSHATTMQSAARHFRTLFDYEAFPAQPLGYAAKRGGPQLPCRRHSSLPPPGPRMSFPLTGGKRWQGQAMGATSLWQWNCRTPTGAGATTPEQFVNWNARPGTAAPYQPWSVQCGIFPD